VHKNTFSLAVRQALFTVLFGAVLIKQFNFACIVESGEKLWDD